MSCSFGMADCSSQAICLGGSMKEDLQRQAHKGNDDNFWWYEENAGIRVYTYEYIIQPDFEINRTSKNRLIPWQSIRAALKRKDMK